MNIKQKIFLIGFFIGLIMVAYLSIDSNKYTRYVVMLGYAISLSCALAYSLSRYDLPTPEPTTKNIESKSIESNLLSNVEDQKTALIDYDAYYDAYKDRYFSFFDLISKDKLSQFDLKNSQYSLPSTCFSSLIDYDAYKKGPTSFFDQTSQNNPSRTYTEFIKSQGPFIVVSNKPIKHLDRQYSK